MKIFLLLIVFQVKHFFADFPLQNEYMLGKFREHGWIAPLSAHCTVHAVLTYYISVLALYTVPGGLIIAAQLSIFDFGIHFLMDRIKASPTLLGRYKALSTGEFRAATLDQKNGNVLFWWSLGFDQMVHHLTHYFIIWRLVVA
jgi:hypothetical protein